MSLPESGDAISQFSPPAPPGNGGGLPVRKRRPAKDTAIMRYMYRRNAPRAERILSLTSKNRFPIYKVNISASASLSGGPAKKAEKRSPNEKKLKKSIFQAEFDLLVFFVCVLASSIVFAFGLFLFFLLLFRLFGKDRSPASSVTGTT